MIAGRERTNLAGRVRLWAALHCGASAVCVPDGLLCDNHVSHARNRIRAFHTAGAESSRTKGRQGLILVELRRGCAMISQACLLTAWGGPKPPHERVAGSLAALAGLASIRRSDCARASYSWLRMGVFLIGVTFMFMFGLNRVIWQVKAAPDVLGRIFSLRVALGIGA